MPPSDADHPCPPVAETAAPRTGRSIRARDYKRPKPYRKKQFVEDPPDISRPRVALLAISGLVVTGLIVALALLVKENVDAPPLLVIAAPMPAAPLAALPVAAPAPPPPSLPRAGVPEADAPAPPLPPAALARVKLAAKRAAPRALPKPELPVADPDVTLIMAILTLTAPAPDPAPPACMNTPAADHGCPAIQSPTP